MNTKEKKYYEGVGRRKEATARVRLFPDSKQSALVNEEKSVADYFKTEELQKIALEALTKASLEEKFLVSVHIKGGGIHAQAEALRHGIARALVVFDEEKKSSLKKEGFLKRDPRKKERRKFGLKKARKRAQWSKR